MQYLQSLQYLQLIYIYLFTYLLLCRCKKIVYFLTVDGSKVPVCKTMFLATLCISDRQVATMQEKKGPDGTLSNEKRGGHFGRASDAVKETADVLARINQFPRIESH